MAAVPIIEVVRNDELYDLNFTVKDYAGAVVNLTNSTVKVKAATIGGAALELDGDCDLVVAANGTCKYTVQTDELATVGLYHAELQVTYTSGKIITTTRFDIRVVKDLP